MSTDPPFLSALCIAVTLSHQGMGAPSLSPGTSLILQGPARAAGGPKAARGAEPGAPLPNSSPTTAAGMWGPDTQIPHTLH